MLRKLTFLIAIELAATSTAVALWPRHLTGILAMERGRETYSIACARCHGDDGNIESYPNVRKLGGIGARLTREQILERLHPVPMGSADVTVRGYLMSPERLNALVAYISSL